MIYAEVQHVSKRFRDVLALDDVTISLQKGKIHGLIGRNGSGKTVLMKCIAGIMTPTSGSIIVSGIPVGNGTIPELGVILEEPGFVSSVSGIRNLRMLAGIRNVIGEGEIRSAMEQVGLDPELKKPVRTYSLGMRHRLAVAQAIMESPPLLLLDEPMNGLDKEGVKQMRALFSRLRESGTTMLISSHHTEDISSLCDEIYEMDQGKIVNKQ